MKNNPIKLIASDMDGTLLDSNGILNPEFFTMFEDLSNKDIMFVAASGRQYYNLLKLFNLIKDKIIFIAENGTYVLFNSQELLIVDVPVEKAREVIREVREIEGAYPVLCGKNKAYIEDYHPDFVKQAYTYYEKCNVVPDLMNVTDDRFLKIAVYDFRGSAINSYPIMEHFNNSLKVVVSGSNWLDVSHRDANKGNALKLIQSYFSVTPDECIAFGDQMNDAEMLQSVVYSYAMENASEELKRYARYTAPSNDAGGVLSVIKESIFNKQ